MPCTYACTQRGTHCSSPLCATCCPPGSSRSDLPKWTQPHNVVVSGSGQSFSRFAGVRQLLHDDRGMLRPGAQIAMKPACSYECPSWLQGHAEVTCAWREAVMRRMGWDVYSNEQALHGGSTDDPRLSQVCARGFCGSRWCRGISYVCLQAMT
jgi:hypothetical protein